jgi:2-dehydropantoate 2-reductase
MIPVVCLQNGVSNEREALRCFDAVWGVNVGCPATHPASGTVYSYAAPGPGRLEIGRWVGGEDRLSADLADLLRSAGFETVVSPDIRAAKYGKLLFNLPNAIDALCGRSARSSQLAENVVAEGASCLRAASIPFVERDDRARIAAAARFARIDGEEFPGGSTAQSLDKGIGVETDYLNGEISLLGRLHGVPTPLNTGLQRLMAEAAAVHPRPPRMPVERLAELLTKEV